MWMVVREDQSGRLHYQYHEIPSNAIGIPAPTAPTTTTVTPSVQQYPRFGRGGLPSFPNYASPSTRSSRKVDVEQYDNVDYGYTSYEPERTHYGRCYVPMTPEAFYYYSKQKNMQHVRHQQPQIMTHPRLPSPDYSPIRNRVRFNVPVSSGEYVSYEKKRSDDEIYEYARIGDVSFDPDPKDEVYAYLRTVDENSSSGASTTSSLGATTPPPVPPLPPPTARMERFSRITRGKPVVDRYQYGGGASSAAALPNRSAPIPYTPASQGITQMGTIAAHHQPQPQDTGSGGSWFSRKDKKKKDKKKIIRKEDISNPTNFQHKAHVGWDQDNGFSNKVYDQEMDESTKNILLAAGMKIDDLNEDERRFAEKFIAKNYDKYVSVDHLSASSSPAPPMPTAMPAVSSYSSSPAATNYAPSVPRQQKPSINYISSPMAPPAPPRVESHGIAPARPPPPPPSTQRDRAAAPARPLPQVPPSSSSSVPPPPPPLPSISSSAPPPPPPPPPMAPMGAGAPPPPPPPPPPMTGGATSSSNILANLPPPQQNRGNLLAEIQAGKQLKSVSQSNISTTSSSGSGDARGDVMAQIRQGAQLRHVDPADAERRKSSNTGMAGAAGMGGLAGALAKALEERRQNMGIDDSSDEEQDDDDKNEWSD